MPRAKTTTTSQTVSRRGRPKSTGAKVTPAKRGRKKDEVIIEEVTPEEVSNEPRRSFLNRRFFVFLIIIGLLALAYYKKGWFVAAMVNGQPISNLELQQKLNQTDRQRVLTQLINETIIEQEAKKKGITVSDAEVNQKLNNMIQTYGGEDSFNQLLSQQGLTRDDLTQQLRVQLIFEKLYATEIAPTDAEIQKYMDDNKDSPEATDAAKFKTTATDAVKQDNLQRVFAQKFQDLKNAAKVQIF